VGTPSSCPLELAASLWLCWLVVLWLCCGLADHDVPEDVQRLLQVCGECVSPSPLVMFLVVLAVKCLTWCMPVPCAHRASD
jgi:hypothetical protein